MIPRFCTLSGSKKSSIFIWSSDYVWGSYSESKTVVKFKCYPFLTQSIF